VFLPTSPRGVNAQSISVDIFTAVRTLNHVQLTPRRRVLLGKLTVAKLVKKFSFFYRTKSFVAMFCNSLLKPEVRCRSVTYFYGGYILGPGPTPKLVVHPLSTVRGCPSYQSVQVNVGRSQIRDEKRGNTVAGGHGFASAARTDTQIDLFSSLFYRNNGTGSAVQREAVAGRILKRK
jgi:hypothetical protein